MNTSKKTKAFVLLLLAGASFFITSCKDNSSEPSYSQEYDSEASADAIASSIGQESGGAGLAFNDALNLANGGSISNESFAKSGNILKRDSSYDDATKTHTIVISREKIKDGFSYTGEWTITYTFYSITGAPMAEFKKGLTDSIVITEIGSHTASSPRVDNQGNSNGTWTITGLSITDSDPVLNGSFSHDGTSTFHTPNNGDKTHTRTLDVTFKDDKLKRGADSLVYLEGSATAHYETTKANGNQIIRDANITFNGDGTATVDVTRTSGDGSVDTYTINVKVGKWLRKGR